MTTHGNDTRSMPEYVSVDAHERPVGRARTQPEKNNTPLFVLVPRCCCGGFRVRAWGHGGKLKAWYDMSPSVASIVGRFILRRAAMTTQAEVRTISQDTEKQPQVRTQCFGKVSVLGKDCPGEVRYRHNERSMVIFTGLVFFSDP